jgi:ADP-heptose:LPS heptosyltransferase
MSPPRSAPSSAPDAPRRLLLLQPRWMGDVLLCTPAIREARRAFPDAVIDFATEPAGGEVLRSNPHLDEVLVDRGGLASRIALLREVVRRRYDAVVDFRSTNSTAQLATASRAPVRIGIRGRGPRNLAYTTLVERIDLGTYAARHKLDMLARLGVATSEVTDLSLELPVGSAAREKAAAVWRANGLDGRTVVAISPVSREAYKQWGAERWAAVADDVTDRGAAVLFTNGPGEIEQVAAVVERMRHAPVWNYGSTTLEELAALLERCELWVGNDGGSKHVAAAAGVPTLSVVRWQIGRVWTDATAPVPQAFLDREPPGGCDLDCGSCSHRGCLAAIPPDEVAAAARGLLSRSGGGDGRLI